MRYLFILLITILFIPKSVSAQNNLEKDSLLKAIDKISIDTLRINKEIEFVRKFYLNNSEMAGFFADKAIDESIKHNYKSGLADAYNLKGIILQNLSKFEEANVLFKKALEIYLKLEKHRGIINCYNNIGLSFVNESKYAEALQYYFNGMKYLDKHPEDNSYVLIYSNISNLYYEVGLFKESDEYLKRALQKAEKILDKNNMVYLYNLRGSLLESLGKIDSSKLYFSKSLLLAKEIKNTTMISATNRNIGKFYLANDSATAMKYFNESLNSLINFDNSVERIRTLSLIAYLHYCHKNYNTAIEYANQTLEISNKINFREGIKNSTLYLSYIYNDLLDYKEAYRYRLIYDSINNNYYQNNSIQSIGNLFQTLEYERREYDLHSGIQEKKIRNLILLVIAFSLFILYLVQRNLTKRANKKQESLVKELTSNAMILAKQNEVFLKIDNILKINKHRFTVENQVTIQEIISQIKLNQNEESWKTFDLYFNKVHKNFHKKLSEHSPNLSINERRLCSLLRLNMTTKEVSSLTLQSSHSINIARGRLRKKLGLANKKTSIYTFLSKY